VLDRSAGWSLIEVAVGLTLIAVILLGVTATLSIAAVGHRSTSSRVESQMLLNRVLEEIQASPYDTLLSFNGTFLVEGDHQANLSVAQADVHLVQIQVDVISKEDPTIVTRGVLLIADTE
jgi:Tfp pilus assembly protein PilV